MSNQTSPTAFKSLYMALAINITDGCDLSNEAHHALLLKKNKVMLLWYLLFILQLRQFNQLHIITNKTESFSFKSEHAMQKQNKHVLLCVPP